MVKKLIAIIVLFCMLSGCALADVGVTGDSVNLRKGSGVDFAVIANVRQGTVLGDLGYIGTDRDGESWYWIEYQGEQCWISAQYAERVVSALDVPPACDFLHQELLGHWKLTSHTRHGSDTDGANSFVIEGAGMTLYLVHDGQDGVSLQGDIRLNYGYAVGQFALQADCAEQPVTAWREKLADMEPQNESWSVRLYDPDEQRDWDFFIDPTDANHLTVYWLLHSDMGYIDMLAFERMDENETDDGSMPETWKALDTELLPGEWKAAYGRIDTYSYEDAKAEGVDSTLSFYRYEHGEVRMNWRRSDDTTLDGIRITAIDAREMSEPLDAPWYIDLTRFIETPGRRAYLYLEDAKTLYIVEEYTIDGMPASDCVVYKRTED